MGTKNNPGKFDCYEAADPDEPMFVLLARDPNAALLVKCWALLREGRPKQAARLIQQADIKRPNAAQRAKDAPKVSEALQCVEDMHAWLAQPDEQTGLI